MAFGLTWVTFEVMLLTGLASDSDEEGPVRACNHLQVQHPLICAGRCE